MSKWILLNIIKLSNVCFLLRNLVYNILCGCHGFADVSGAFKWNILLTEKMGVSAPPFSAAASSGALFADKKTVHPQLNSARPRSVIVVVNGLCCSVRCWPIKKRIKRCIADWRSFAVSAIFSVVYRSKISNNYHQNVESSGIRDAAEGSTYVNQKKCLAPKGKYCKTLLSFPLLCKFKREN